MRPVISASRRRSQASVSTQQAAAFVSQHSMRLSGLRPDTLYRYRVRSTDLSGNAAALTSWDYFRTPPAEQWLSGAVWNWGAIPSTPVLDTNSATYIDTLVNTPVNGSYNTNKVIATHTYGVPIFEIPRGATTGFSTYSVTTTKYHVRTVAGVRIPNGAAPQPNSPNGSDGAMVIIDWDAGVVHEFYEAQKVSGNWTAGDMSTYPIASTGRNDADIAVGQTGWGCSRSLGIIRRTELEAAWPSGNLGHALAFSSNVAGNTFRYPAVKSDGVNLAGAATPIPEGARLQLDPAYDVNGSGTMNALEKVIARTLQVYGAYVIDQGNSRMAFNLEGSDPAQSAYSPPVDAGDPSAAGGWGVAYGLNANTVSLTNIPWASCRFLKNYDGSA